MADGSRLGVTDAADRAGAGRGDHPVQEHAPSGLERAGPDSRADGTVAYLSDRPATAEQYVAYLGPTRPYRRDLNVDGHPLRLAGQGYDRGLGTQSRTLLAYRLDCRRPAVPGPGRPRRLGRAARERGLPGPGRWPASGSSRRRCRSATRRKSIDVDLTGAKFLILMTEFGERGEVRDFADWVEARIIH